MTEKRFTKYVPDSYGYTYITTIIDNEKNKQTGNIDEIVDMLNELADENEQLKSEIEKLSYANEDLLSEKRNWQRMSDEYCKLSDENEHIKNTIQEAYHNERTQLGKSVLKQLMETIQ